MSTDRDTTRIVRSWLKRDEHEDAGAILESVLERIDTIPQRRTTLWPARRFAGVNNAVRIAIAATFVGLAGIVGLNVMTDRLGGQPVDTVPSPTPSGPTETPVFTSERHGYSLRLADGWQVSEVGGTWRLGATFHEENHGVDNVIVEDALRNPYILINSQAVPAGMTFDDWYAAYEQVNREYFTKDPEYYTGLTENREYFIGWTIESTASSEIDGEPARVNRTVSSFGDRGMQLSTFHAGRAYVIRVFGPPDPTWDPASAMGDVLARFQFTD